MSHSTVSSYQKYGDKSNIIFPIIGTDCTAHPFPPKPEVEEGAEQGRDEPPQLSALLHGECDAPTHIHDGKQHIFGMFFW